MRRISVLVSVGVLAALSGCGDDDSANFSATSTAAPACRFQAGALPAETLPAAAPHGDAMPVDHIIIMMQENRSFDSYFGRLPEAGHADVDGLPSAVSNPDSNGSPISVFHQTAYCTEDTNHSWTGSHLEYNGGTNDGFVLQNNPQGARALGYYDETDLPFAYALANTFAIGDRYFCSVLGPTFPNRFYLLAGTSFGHIRNDMQMFDQPNIFSALEDHHVTWIVYHADFTYASLFKLQRRRLSPLSAFFSDAAAGTLPQVTFIDSAIGLVGPETDEHPPADFQEGQQLVASVVQAVIASPSWPRTVMFLTYDEHGGFYDHVPPPAACVPDNIGPMLDPADPDSSLPAQFDRYGFRVPMIAISPYAKPGFVSHAVYDHTSVLRFIETRFDLPALTNRDANADPLLDLFDFAHPALLAPPPMPTPAVDQAHLEQCRADFPSKVY